MAKGWKHNGLHCNGDIGLQWENVLFQVQTQFNISQYFCDSGIQARSDSRDRLHNRLISVRVASSKSYPSLYGH